MSEDQTTPEQTTDAAVAVNDQITDAVTQAAPEPSPQCSDSVTQGTPCDTDAAQSETNAVAFQENVTSVVVTVAPEANVGAGESAPSTDPIYAALENCRLYAAKRPKEEWARTILRFCADAGVTGSPLRG